MKKLCSASVIAAIIAAPAFADNVQPNIAVGTNPADCTESVLETTSGTSNLEANWNANTLYLSWSVDGQPYATNDSNAASCTYDSGITIPTNPTKTGYTFAGWMVKPAVQQCDLSGLSDTTTNGKAHGYSRFTNDAGSSEAKYGLTPGGGEWATEFYHGIVKGQALCSTVGSGYTIGQTGNPTDDLNTVGARYCWCKITGYTPKPWIYDTGDASSSPIYLTGYTDQSNCKKAIGAITGLSSTNANTLLNKASSNNPQLITNATGANVAYLIDSGCTTSGGASVRFGEVGNACPVSSLWAFSRDYGSAALCASNCPNYCGTYVRNHEALRAGLYGSISQ